MAKNEMIKKAICELERYLELDAKPDEPRAPERQAVEPVTLNNSVLYGLVNMLIKHAEHTEDATFDVVPLKHYEASIADHIIVLTVHTGWMRLEIEDAMGNRIEFDFGLDGDEWTENLMESRYQGRQPSVKRAIDVAAYCLAELALAI